MSLRLSVIRRLLSELGGSLTVVVMVIPPDGVKTADTRFSGSFFLEENQARGHFSE